MKAKNFLKKAKENGNLEDIIASANMFSPISIERYSDFRLKFQDDKYFLFTISREQVNGNLSQQFLGSFSFNQFIDKLNDFFPNIKSLKNKAFLYNNI